MVSTPSPGPPLIKFSGSGSFTIRNSLLGGAPTAIRAEGSQVTATGVDVRNVGTGLHLTNGAAGVTVDSTIRGAREAGIRIEDSFSYSEGLTIENSNIGLDIGPRSQGAIRGSKIIDNDIDIRYHRDSVVHIFDTTARYVLDRTRMGSGIQSINDEWICHRVICTTDLGEMARGIGKLIRSGAIKAAGGHLASLAGQCAKVVLQR